MRTKKTLWAAAAALPVAAAVAWLLWSRPVPADGPTPAAAPKSAAADYRLSGPYAHDNLSVFLVHGEDRLQGKTFLTLAEALAQKKFVIHETQAVNQLTMENLSPTEEVLILSGDILKGGQQDRIAQYDMIVPPKSGKRPLPAFCVEHTAARWMRPLSPKDGTFAGNPGVVCTNSIRLANRLEMSQSRVWRNVSRAQAMLGENARKSVKVAESDSSLALSVQVKEVREAVEKYIARLTPVLEGKQDVVGYAFAINGKMVAADVYGSPALFRKLWPRLLDATATEAFSEKRKDAKVAPVRVELVKDFLEKAEKGKTSSRDVGKELRQVTTEADNNVLFETLLDAKKKGSYLRRNYLAK